MHAGFRILKKVQCACVLLAVLAISAGGWAEEPRTGVGQAEALSGAVYIERNGNRESLGQGAPVFLGDTVRTGASGAVEIAFPDGSRAKLAAGAILEITGYLFNPSEKIRRCVLSLVTGRVGLVVQDFPDYSDRRFRVQTPTAVVGSRDTVFVVSRGPENACDAVCGEGMVEVLCLENAVVVFSNDFPDRLSLLAADMINRVCGYDLPTPPRFVTPAEKKRLISGMETFLKVPSAVSAPVP